MKKMIALLLMGSAVLFVTGCNSAKEFSGSLKEAAATGEISSLNEKMVVKNKTTKKEMLEYLGAPSLVFANEIGGESWVYSRIAVRQSNVAMVANGAFAAAFPYNNSNLSKGGGIAGVDAGLGISTGRTSYKSAALLIRFNSNGCVSSYEFTAAGF